MLKAFENISASFVTLAYFTVPYHVINYLHMGGTVTCLSQVQPLDLDGKYDAVSE